MKRVKYAIVALLVIFAVRTYGDVIIHQREHSPLKVCVKITNLKDYPDIEVIGLSDCITVFSRPKVNTFNSHLYVAVHKACPLTFYAVKKDYLKEKGIKNIHWEKDKNVRKADVSVDAKKTIVYYPGVEILRIHFIIAGFDEKSMVMYKTSEINKFNDGTPNKVIDFRYPGIDESWPETRNLSKDF